MGWIKRRIYLILVAAKTALLAWAYFKGRQGAEDERAARDMRDYHDTRKRIDQIARDGDTDSQREWLHERGRK
jgi:hypothetical protein